MQRSLALASLAAALVGTALIKLHVDRVTADLWGGGPVSLITVTGDLTRGAALRAEDLATASIPERFRESRHVLASRREDLIGLRIGEPVKAGELLLMSDLAGMGASDRSLAELVADGTRAMPIRVAHSGFSRLVHPGDRVDVLMSERTSSDTKTRTLLENILVLAVGDDLGDFDSQGKHQGGRVTLNVTPEQGHILASAETTGTLRLTLRNASDHLRLSERHGS